MSRTEQYRHLATDVRSRASREANPMLKAEWENLAETYVRLAEQSDDKWDTDDLTYDPNSGHVGSHAALTDSTSSIRSSRAASSPATPRPRDPEASVRVALRDVCCPSCNGHGKAAHHRLSAPPVDLTLRLLAEQRSNYFHECRDTQPN